MNGRSSSRLPLLLAMRRSRRSLLKSFGAGAALLGAGTQFQAVSAQSGPSSAEVDALYSSAAAMPHLFAEFVLPFVLGGWEVNGRGTLLYSLDTAIAAEAVSTADAGLLGAPDAIYVASFILPAGESWTTARYLTIFNSPPPDDAAAAAGRFVAAGAPAGATDLTANLDPALGAAISYAVTADLEGTPAEQVFCIFASGTWLFRYYSLTPQVAALLGPPLAVRVASGLAADAAFAPGEQRSLAARRLGIGRDVAGESGALAAIGLILGSPGLIREMLIDKGYTDEEINNVVNLLFPTRFAASTATRIDYVKHNRSDYFQFASPDAANELQRGYYAEAMCAFADDGPIPPANTNYFYATKRFFMSADEATAFFNAQPTPAQDASHSANGVMFQDDPDSSTADIKASFISWQPAQATSTLPGYGFSRLRGPVVSHFNVYNVNPPPDGPTAIDPAHPLYQSLKTGVLNILDQQAQFDANPTGWPVFATPDAFVG